MHANLLLMGNSWFSVKSKCWIIYYHLWNATLIAIFSIVNVRCDWVTWFVTPAVSYKCTLIDIYLISCDLTHLTCISVSWDEREKEKETLTYLFFVCFNLWEKSTTPSFWKLSKRQSDNRTHLKVSEEIRMTSSLSSFFLSSHNYFCRQNFFRQKPCLCSGCSPHYTNHRFSSFSITTFSFPLQLTLTAQKNAFKTWTQPRLLQQRRQMP